MKKSIVKQMFLNGKKQKIKCNIRDLVMGRRCCSTSPPPNHTLQKSRQPVRLNDF